MNWFDREEERLGELFDTGEITQEEYREEMRELRLALRQEAEEAAQNTYDSFFL